MIQRLILLLSAFLALTSAVEAGRLRVVGHKVAASTPTGGGGVTASVTYDTSIGNGVDANGFADLPLRSGAKRFFLNSSTGFDSNTCTQAQSASTPKATITSAISCITGGEGDQVLVAEGTTYAVAIDSHVGLNAKSGFSAVYPTVIESYPPSDPTNEAKLGRASGGNRPVFTGTADSYFLTNSGTPTNYLAFRGLDFNPGNVDGPAVGSLGTATGQHNYQLFENDKFQYTMLNFGMAAVYGSPGLHYIIRNSSFHGSWHSSGDQQSILASYTDGLTVEDSVFYHSGWNESVARGAATSLGGPSNLSHPIYAQDDTRDNVIRRNVFIQGAADCGRIKGGGIYQNNLCFNSPIFVDNGGGNNYVIDEPFGGYNDVSGNVDLGGGTIDGSAGGGWGPHLVSSKQGSTVRGNVIARSVDTTTALGLLTDAKNENITDASAHPTWSPAPVAFALPDYVDFNYNVMYLWNASGNTKAEGLSGTTDLTKIHATYGNNVWADPTSGTNTNIGSVSLPNAYTLSTLLTTINPAYVDLATAQAAWLAFPEQHGWETGPALAKAGYGVATQTLVDLKTDTQITVGMPITGQFIGTLDGSTLTSSGLPTGVTLDSDGRAWRYDGSGTAGTPSSTITETNGVSTHNTTLSWTVSARPVLSSLTKTSSSTATISTNVGGGQVCWEVTPLATTPDWTYVRVGLKADLSGTALAFGCQTVSATGTQTLTGLSNLTTGNNLFVSQLGPNENPSLTSTLAF